LVPMKYAVLSDIHWGTKKTIGDVSLVVKRLRSEGYTPIFAGDIFDVWRDKDVVLVNEHKLKDGDIFIQGNHDYNVKLRDTIVQYPFGLTVTSGDKTFFITHGDCVDFMYAFALLESIQTNGTDNLLYFVLSKLKDWQAEDVFNFYKGMNRMPEWVTRALEHKGGWWFKRLSAFAVTIVLMYAAFQKSPPKLFPKMDVESGDILSKQPRELAYRIELFFPEAKHADTLIMGHLHSPFRAPISKGDDSRELISLGAWVEGGNPTVALIDKGQVETKCWNELANMPSR